MMRLPGQPGRLCGVLNLCWHYHPRRGGFVTRPGGQRQGNTGKRVSRSRHTPAPEPGRVTNPPLPSAPTIRRFILRQAQDERGDVATQLDHAQPTQDNHIIIPSFRRKPESRVLDSQTVLFRGISWIPAFAGTTVAWVAPPPYPPTLTANPCRVILPRLFTWRRHGRRFIRAFTR